MIKDYFDDWRLCLTDYRVKKSSKAKMIFEKLLNCDAIAKQRTLALFRETLARRREFLVWELPSRQKVVRHLRRAIYANIGNCFMSWQNMCEKANIIDQMTTPLKKKVLHKIFDVLGFCEEQAFKKWLFFIKAQLAGNKVIRNVYNTLSNLVFSGWQNCFIKWKGFVHQMDE